MCIRDRRSKEYRTIRASNCILARTHARTYKETRILVEHVSILLADSAPIKLWSIWYAPRRQHQHLRVRVKSESQFQIFGRPARDAQAIGARLRTMSLEWSTPRSLEQREFRRFVTPFPSASEEAFLGNIMEKDQEYFHDIHRFYLSMTDFFYRCCPSLPLCC